MIASSDSQAIATELRRVANDSLNGESLQRALARITGANDSSWRGVMRHLADLIEPPAFLINPFICEKCGESGALFYRLADLIDRPTCTFDGMPERIGYACSNCGQTFTRRPLMAHVFGNDTQVEIPFRFCPYCGAEVVTDDE